MAGCPETCVTGLTVFLFFIFFKLISIHPNSFKLIVLCTNVSGMTAAIVSGQGNGWHLLNSSADVRCSHTCAISSTHNHPICIRLVASCYRMLCDLTIAPAWWGQWPEEKEARYPLFFFSFFFFKKKKFHHSYWAELVIIRYNNVEVTSIIY